MESVNRTGSGTEACDFVPRGRPKKRAQEVVRNIEFLKETPLH